MIKKNTLLIVAFSCYVGVLTVEGVRKTYYSRSLYRIIISGSGKINKLE